MKKKSKYWPYKSRKEALINAITAAMYYWERLPGSIVDEQRRVLRKIRKELRGKK